MVSREVVGAEAVIAYDTDLRHLTDLIQRNDRISVLGTLRILSALAKNSYKRVCLFVEEP